MSGRASTLLATTLSIVSLACGMLAGGCGADRMSRGSPTPAPGPSAEPSPEPPLLTAASSLRLIAAGVKYDGMILPWSDTLPERAAAEPGFQEVIVNDTSYFYGPGFLTGVDRERREARRYALFDLAIAAGWYRPKDNEYLPSSPRGLFAVEHVLWMGSDGVGVITFDTRDRSWARYAVQAEATPGFHVTVHYADQDYVFASYGGHRDVPGAEPSLHVFSISSRKWLKIVAIPVRKALSLGHTNGLPLGTVSMAFDLRPYAERDSLPIVDYPVLSRPTGIVRETDGSYLLRYLHAGDSRTELHIRVSDLVEPFWGK